MGAPCRCWWILNHATAQSFPLNLGNPHLFHCWEISAFFRFIFTSSWPKASWLPSTCILCPTVTPSFPISPKSKTHKSAGSSGEDIQQCKSEKFTPGWSQRLKTESAEALRNKVHQVNGYGQGIQKRRNTETPTNLIFFVFWLCTGRWERRRKNTERVPPCRPCSAGYHLPLFRGTSVYVQGLTPTYFPRGSINFPLSEQSE